jgi:gamma-glutamylputrescine oxidase
MSATAWDLPVAPLPVLTGDLRADVCVVGLGGTGLTALRALQRLGVRRLVGVDAGGVAAGAAGRNGGFLLAGPARFHHRAVEAWGREPARRLYQLTLSALDELARRFPRAVDRVGSVRLAVDPSEGEDIAAHAEALSRDGFAVRPWSGPDGEGILLPEDGVLHPVERCVAMAETAWEEDAWLYGNSPVTALEGDRVVTPRGTVQAERILVCIDGGLERLLPELAGRVRTHRLQMLATAPVSPGRWRHAMYARFGMDYWQQRPDGRVLLGGFRDRDPEADAPQVQAVATEPVQGALDGWLRDRLGVAAPITHRWAGLVGFTPDDLPLCEEVRDGVWVAGGYSGTGNVLGALCGEALAAVVAGRPRPELLDVLDAARQP